jgi:hypothetical protein
LNVVFVLIVGGLFLLTGLWALSWGGPLWLRAVQNQRTIYPSMLPRDKKLLRVRWIVGGSICTLTGLTLLLIAPHLA